MRNRKNRLMTAFFAAMMVFQAAGAAYGQWRTDEAGQWHYEQNGADLNNGWNQIDGKWYYFRDNGVMASDEVIDGWYVGEDGAWQEDSRSRYEKKGDDAQDIISNYLEKDTKYSLTVEELKAKNPAAYTAGNRSVYGVSLNQAELDQVAQKVQEIVTTYITNDMTDIQKVDMLYCYLTNTCSYAASWDQNRANTAWGALIYGEAQCSGYSRAFKALCDAVDIPCYYVHANEAAYNPSHQWNIVNVGGNWYHVDTQAGIFLVSDTVYANQGLEWNRDEFPQCPASYFTIQDEWGFPLPYVPGVSWLKK